MAYDENEDGEDIDEVNDIQDQSSDDNIDEENATSVEDADDDAELKGKKGRKQVVIKSDESSGDDDISDDEPNLEEEHYYTEDPDWKGIRYFIFEGHIVRVPFSKFFGKEAEDYEELITSCVSKKAYHKMMRLFSHSNNVILNGNKKTAETFIYKYYCIKRDIDNASYNRTTHSQFVNAIVNLFDINIMNEIRKYVNACYTPTGDIKYEDNKATFVPSITFLDYHIKVLYVVSCMTHFIIPLCLEYLREYRETNTNTLLVDTFLSLFPIAETIDPINLVPLDANERKVDVYQKLYSFVEAKVEDTRKSDAAMWERQEFLGVNYKTTIEDIVNKLVTNIVPEYDFKGNIMHLNVSVVRKSIQDYTLRKKDPFNINCFVDVDSNTQSDDNAVVTEAEQFDSYNAKHDELPIVIRHTFMDHTVNTILARKNMELDPNLIQFYMQNLKMHEFQQFAIFSSFHQYFGGTENMYGINQEMYVKLMLAVIEMMNRSGIGSIAKYVSGAKDKHYISKKDSRLSRSELIIDPLYSHIISTKYKNVKNVITKKNNFIENKITYLMSNEFIYNTPIAELNGKIIPRDENEIRTGVLQFFNSLIY